MKLSYRRFAPIVLGLLLLATATPAQRLFVGLENPTLLTRSSDLTGFPTVSWTNHFAFEVNGAAATPEGLIYLCNGPFTTRLYTSTLDGPPVFVTNVSVDIHGMGYGNGRLYGFSNFTSPMGIYEIDPVTGQATLAVNTASQGYRFFGLDFNPVDGLLYGYTEYGVGGLYSIDPISGAMVHFASYPPGVGGQGRALAVGNQMVYLLATRGDEGEPVFAYDLDQGVGGTWTAFTNPYPTEHATGGACWIPASADAPDQGGLPPLRPRLWISGPNPSIDGTTLSWRLPSPGLLRIDLFDAAGRWVRTLAGGTSDVGPHSIPWDGADGAGRDLAGGIYHARLVTDQGVETVKIVTAR